MNQSTKEKVFIAMMPYLRPDAPPLSLAILKGVFSTYGVQCKTYDLNLEVLNFFTKYEIQLLEKFCSDGVWKNKNIVKKIRKFFRHSIKKYIMPFKPTIVGASLFSFFMQRPTELFCLELKNLLPEVSIFLGGSGVTKFLRNKSYDDWSKKIIKQGLVDHVIIGEGEQAVIDFLKNKNQGIRIVPQIKDLAAFSSIPDFNDIEISKYQNTVAFTSEKTIPITGSRGCVRKCSFCNVDALWPKFVFKPAKQIVNEMETFMSKHKIKNFKFTDSLINGSNKQWRELNLEIIKRKLNLNYSGQFIAKPIGQTTEEDYDLAKEAGCKKLWIGIESGSESVRNHMRKKFDNHSLYTMIENLSKRKIKQEWMLITGYPTETDKDFQQTLDLIKKFKKYKDLISLSFVSFVLLPDSPIVWDDKYNDLNFISEKSEEGSIVNYWICKQNPVLNFKKRLERFTTAKNLGIELGYTSTNKDKFKKTIMNYTDKESYETQIHS